MLEERRRLGLGGGLSAVLHGAGALLLGVAPPIPRRALDLQPVTVEWATSSVARARREAEPREAVRSEAPRALETVRRSDGRRAHRAQELPRTATSEGEGEGEGAPLPMPMPEEPPAMPREPPRLDLDPAAVVGALVLRDDRGPALPGPPAPRSAPVREGVSAEAALAAVEEHLRREARRRPGTERAPVHLVPHPDGTFTYTSDPRFRAVIHEDGAIEIREADGASYEWQTGSGTFDLEGLLMGAAGQSPCAGAVEAFFDEIEPFLVEHEAAFRARREERALRRLRGQIVRLWSDDSRSRAERRREIFELWNETSDDELGARARRIILDLVRELMPRGSPEAYGDEELAALGALTAHADAFAPYE